MGERCRKQNPRVTRTHFQVRTKRTIVIAEELIHRAALLKHDATCGWKRCVAPAHVLHVVHRELQKRNVITPHNHFHSMLNKHDLVRLAYCTVTALGSRGPRRINAKRNHRTRHVLPRHGHDHGEDPHIL